MLLYKHMLTNLNHLSSSLEHTLQAETEQCTLRVKNLLQDTRYKLMIPIFTRKMKYKQNKDVSKTAKG